MSTERAHSQATDMSLSRRRFIAKASALSGRRSSLCPALSLLSRLQANDFRFIDELKKELRT
jgi:hypothetical protein